MLVLIYSRIVKRISEIPFKNMGEKKKSELIEISYFIRMLEIELTQCFKNIYSVLYHAKLES